MASPENVASRTGAPAARMALTCQRAYPYDALSPRPVMSGPSARLTCHGGGGQRGGFTAEEVRAISRSDDAQGSQNNRKIRTMKRSVQWR